MGCHNPPLQNVGHFEQHAIRDTPMLLIKGNTLIEHYHLANRNQRKGYILQLKAHARSKGIRVPSVAAFTRCRSPLRTRYCIAPLHRPLHWAINASFKSGWFEVYMWSSVSLSLDSYPILSRMARPTSWWQASTIDRPGHRIRR